LVVRFPTPIEVTGDSATSSAWAAAVAAGIVTDGSIAARPGGLYGIAETHAPTIFYRYTFAPNAVVTQDGYPYATYDPSAQQSQSEPFLQWLPLFACYLSGGGCLSNKPQVPTSFTSNDSLYYDDVYGSGVLGEWIPTLAQLNLDLSGNDQTLQVIFSQDTITTFQRPFGGSTFVAAAGGHDTLVHDEVGHKYVMTRASGDKYMFNDFSAELPERLRGRLLVSSDAAGNSNTFVYANNRIETVQRRLAGAGSDYETWQLTYEPSTGLISSVVESRPVLGVGRSVFCRFHESWSSICFGTLTALVSSGVQSGRVLLAVALVYPTLSEIPGQG
jgi:hypothetical protein